MIGENVFTVRQCNAHTYIHLVLFLWIIYLFVQHSVIQSRKIFCTLIHQIVSPVVRAATHWMSQLMRLWYLSHRRPAKAQASLRIRAVSPEPSLFAHMKYGSRWRVIQTSSPTGWLRMHVWRMSLRKTKRAIITWAGSNVLFYRVKMILLQSQRWLGTAYVTVKSVCAWD